MFSKISLRFLLQNGPFSTSISSHRNPALSSIDHRSAVLFEKFHQLSPPVSPGSSHRRRRRHRPSLENPTIHPRRWKIPGRRKAAAFN